MRKLTRYLAIAFAVVAVAITAISPLATSFVNNGHDTDIELRAELVFNSVRDELIALLANGETKQIDALFDRFALDERLWRFGGGALRPQHWSFLVRVFRTRFPGWEGRRAMRKASRFSDAQKAFILKQGADGMPVADVCCKAGISQATYQLEEKVRRPAADRDAAAQAA